MIFTIFIIGITSPIFFLIWTLLHDYTKNPKLIALKRDISLASQSVLLDDSITFALKKYKIASERGT